MPLQNTVADAIRFSALSSAASLALAAPVVTGDPYAATANTDTNRTGLYFGSPGVNARQIGVVVNGTECLHMYADGSIQAGEGTYGVALGAGRIGVAASVTITQPTTAVNGDTTLAVDNVGLSGVAASTEMHDFSVHQLGTTTWQTGDIVLQRSVHIERPMYAFAGPSTIGRAVTLAIDGPPIAGANAVFTAEWSVWVEEGGVCIGTQTAPAAPLPNVKLQTWDAISSYLQNNIQNLDNGNESSCDWVATCDTGDDTTGFIDFGIGSSGWSAAWWTISGPADGYLYTADSNLAVGTGGATEHLTLFTGGTLSGNERMRIYADGGVQIGGTYASGPGIGSLQTDQDSYFNGVRVGRGSAGSVENTVVGYSAFVAAVPAICNVTMGTRAYESAYGGSYNIAIGWEALRYNQWGSQNTAVGMAALMNNTDSHNTAIGADCMRSNTGGMYNTAVGNRALISNQTGGQNTAIGYKALESCTDSYNTAIGYSALRSLTGGFGNWANSAHGKGCLENLVTGKLNVAMGDQAGDSQSGGDLNTYLGAESDLSGGAWTNSTALGARAIITASNQMMLGADTVTQTILRGATSVYDGVTERLRVFADGGVQVGGTYAAGPGAGSLQTAADGYFFDVRVGRGAGGGATNTAVGASAMATTPSGPYSTAVGNLALVLGGGGKNTAVGYRSLTSASSGLENCAFGTDALGSLATGDGNCAFGFAALASQQDRYCVAVGAQALDSLNGARLITAIGYRAGRVQTGGGWANTYLGAESNTDHPTNWENITAVGYYAICTQSNMVQLGATTVTLVRTSGTILAGGTIYAQTDVLTDAATVNYVASDSDNFTLLLTSAVGSTRLLATPTALVSGMRWVIRVKQPASGGPCGLTFSADYKFPFGVTPTLSGGADVLDTISCYYDGTVILAQVVNSYGTVSAPDIIGSTLNVSGSVNLPDILVTGDTSLTSVHYTICVDATAGPVAITLPDTATVSNRGRVYNVKKVDASANAVTITRAGTDTIDGATTSVLSVQYQSRTVHSRTAGGVWDII